MADLTPRERELIEAFVAAWEASSHTPFDFNHDAFEHPNWPAGVAIPEREEVRALHHRGLLEDDDSVAPTWRVFPSVKAREVAGVATEEALADPDRRLGLILQATVQAFEQNPSEPLGFLEKDGFALVRHEHWPLQPDVVKAHDLQQLEELGFVATRQEERRSMTFWPTIDGRAAIKDPEGYLGRLAVEAEDEDQRSRFRRLAERFRASDVAVGAAGSAPGLLIRLLTGLG